MAAIVFSKNGNTPFQQLLGHNPEVLKCWSILEKAVFNSGVLDLDLKEEVRRTLAFSNKCHY